MSGPLSQTLCHFHASSPSVFTAGGGRGLGSCLNLQVKQWEPPFPWKGHSQLISDRCLGTSGSVEVLLGACNGQTGVICGSTQKRAVSPRRPQTSTRCSALPRHLKSSGNVSVATGRCRNPSCRTCCRCRWEGAGTEGGRPGGPDTDSWPGVGSRPPALPAPFLSTEPCPGSAWVPVPADRAFLKKTSLWDINGPRPRNMAFL